MAELYFVSDTHFAHANILKFINFDGDQVRPEFGSVEEMDEVMIEKWNATVRPEDHIYHLGDVSFDLTSYQKIMPRLNGHKRLILGNHDKFKMSEYMKYFEKIMESWQPTRRTLFTHRPVLLEESDPREIYNVHGHVHRRREEFSPRHLNVSIEMTDYSPIHWDEVCKRLGISNER